MATSGPSKFSSGPTAASAGSADAVALPADAPSDGFALRLKGWLKVAKDGVYQFYLTSDDGSQLWVGDELVVDGDGVERPFDEHGPIRPHEVQPVHGRAAREPGRVVVAGLRADRSEVPPDDADGCTVYGADRDE